MQQANFQQLDVTESRETVADLLRRLRRAGRPVELIIGGRVVARVVPGAEEGEGLEEVSREEQEQAWKRLGKIQQKVGRMMRRTGKTEDDLMRILLADD